MIRCDGVQFASTPVASHEFIYFDNNSGHSPFKQSQSLFSLLKIATQLVAYPFFSMVSDISHVLYCKHIFERTLKETKWMHEIFDSVRSVHRQVQENFKTTFFDVKLAVKLKTLISFGYHIFFSFSIITNHIRDISSGLEGIGD